MQTTGAYEPELDKVLSSEEILQLQDIVRKVPVADHAANFAVKLVRMTRPDAGAPDFVKQSVSWGAGPRGAQAIILGAKARAILQGRYAVSVDDIKAVAFPGLRHRIIMSFHGEAEGMKTEQLIQRLIENTEKIA